MKMAAEGNKHSEVLEEVLLTLQSEFTELEQEYGANFEQNSVISEVEDSSMMPDEDSDLDEENTSLSELVGVEVSEMDIQEDSMVQTFLSNTCKCHLGVGNKPCCLTLPLQEIKKCRMSCSELSHNELDLVVMSQVHYFRTTSEGASTASFRPISNYYFHGVRICQATFLFVHCISRNRYLRIVELYKNEGLTMSRHGNSGRLPKHTCSIEQVQEVKSFIVNYARAHGLPVPGRLPNAKGKVLLLPSDMSKMFVFRKYSEASDQPVRKSKFLELWSQLTPSVAVMKPASDLCFACQQNNLSIKKAAPMSETVRQQRYDNASAHLDQARDARYYYRKQCDDAEKYWKAHLDCGNHVRLCIIRTILLNNIPFDSQQTGPAYFKTARKCGIFGVSCEGNCEQVNYLIDEAENPGKGADCTISLVHHYLENYGCGEQNVCFHADNCTKIKIKLMCNTCYGES